MLQNIPPPQIPTYQQPYWFTFLLLVLFYLISETDISTYEREYNVGYILFHPLKKPPKFQVFFHLSSASSVFPFY